MADKYTIQINPQLSASDAQKMEQDLNRRFSNVAKKFGSNLGNSLKTAAKVGASSLAAGIVATLATNPFEKVNEDFNKTINISDELVTRAGQFGVTTSKLAELNSIAKSVGLDTTMLLQQFSAAQQEAREFKAGDTTKNNALLNFINDKSVIDSLYAFAEQMQKLDGTKRGIEVSRIFGDKMESKIAEFLQITDFNKRSKETQGKYSYEEVGAAAERTAILEDYKAILEAIRGNEEIVIKSKAISRGTVESQDREARAKLSKETQQLLQYEIFANLSASQNRMAQSIDEIKTNFTSMLTPAIEGAASYTKRIYDWLNRPKKTIKLFVD